jgi:RNA 2',3'-cyclic 3'-phosphodiesterase
MKYSDPMKRLFIAVKVDPEESLLKMISSFKSGLYKDIIKWTDPGNIHITLAFLGETEEKMIKPISSMLKENCEGSGKFELVIKGAGLFRNPDDPRIIWTSINTSEKLLHINDLIKKGLNGLGIKTEERPFKPHLTIGRVRHINDKETLKTLVEKFQNSEIQIVPVNEIVLYQSILLPSGPIYKPLVFINL